MRHLKLLAIYLLISAPAGASSASEFDRIWDAISSQSPKIQSENFEKSAAELRVSRTSRHWLPRLSLGAGAISTNGPAAALFSTLSSRSLQSSDLSPSTMNEPSRQWFKSGRLTLDLPLFEGGMRTSASRAAKLTLESQTLLLQASTDEVYSEFVRNFVLLVSLEDSLANLHGLKVKLENVVQRYRVGSQDNPVGYSGLLGMRSLLNRLESLEAANRSESNVIVETLKIKSRLPELDLSHLGKSDAIVLAKQKLNSTSNSPTENLQAKSMQVAAQAQAQLAQAEKAKWLPKVGLVASEDLVSGPRNTGTSTEYGIYLQWQLFDGTQLGAHREAVLHAQAAETRAEEQIERARIARKMSETNLPTLIDNLGRVAASTMLAREQTNVTERLFRNGSVNALQFSEVLSRHADLIESKGQLERLILSQLVESYLMNRSKM